MSDLISRQAAIDALGDRPMVWMDSAYEIAQRNQYDRDRLAIETVPSAQPERKKGKWSFIGYQMFECTECGTFYTQSQFQQMRVMITDPEFPRFCPTCGADMREEGDK